MLVLGLAALAGFLLWDRLTARRRFKRLLVSARATAEQLRRNVAELEAGRGQIEGILQSMAEGVLVFDSGERLVLVNASARRILQVPPEAGWESPMLEVMRQPDLQSLVQSTLRTGQPAAREVKLYAPAEMDLEAKASLCRIPGRGACALLLLHDISGLKKLEQIRREFVANVSHELKTPLTAIQSAVEALLGGALSDREHGRAFVEAVRQESLRLQRLVEDLLALAQLEAVPAGGRRQPLQLRSFLEQQLARFRRVAETAQVRLRLSLEEAPDSIPADRTQLAQAVGNLLDNAIQYNRPGGEVILRAAPDPDGGTVRIEVEDTGIGIPAEDLPRVFERFYRIDKARSRRTGGTGLGLSIVKHVAEAHGGSVRAESALGQGSRFTLILPTLGLFHPGSLPP